MIKDLVVRLMAEANQEADHKSWCDKELGTNGHTRKEKTQAVETLHAAIDELKASIAQVTENVNELQKALAELDATAAKATQMRNDEKKKNAEIIADSKDAQAAVTQAMTTIQEFYAKAAEATALLQQPYKGMQDDNKSVVAMLEVMSSDYARLESATSAADATAQKEYENLMTETKVGKAEKGKELEFKVAKKQDKTQSLTEMKRDLEGTQKELDAALTYFDKLKPSCIDAGTSYEERVTRRKQEIESLQTALKIMTGDDVAAA